jgi:hypothetical protein
MAEWALERSGEPNSERWESLEALAATLRRRTSLFQSFLEPDEVEFWIADVTDIGG